MIMLKVWQYDYKIEYVCARARSCARVCVCRMDS